MRPRRRKKLAKARMTTRCLNCGKVLTTEKGERVESAHFDTSLPARPLEPTTTWARCERCYEAATCYQGDAEGGHLKIDTDKVAKAAGYDKERPCVLCGHPLLGATIHDFKFDEKRTRIDWPVCPNHLATWVVRRLTPEQVKMLRQIAGCETFATHEDFYDEDGNGRAVVTLLSRPLVRATT